MEFSKAQWQQMLCTRHGAALQNRFAAASVAICGLGGLGSNIAIALARAGIGRLILIDFDRVDFSNLGRQQYKASQVGKYKTEALAANLAEIAPFTAVEIHTVKLSEKNACALLCTADIICEALDDAAAKAMLTAAVLEHLPEQYLVAASGMAGLGSANAIRSRRITGRFYLCGDNESDVSECGTLFSARAMLCAAHQAHTVLRILAEEYDI